MCDFIADLLDFFVDIIVDIIEIFFNLHAKKAKKQKNNRNSSAMRQK